MTRAKIIISEFEKEVTSSGNGGHIVVSKDFIGDTAEVRIKRTIQTCKKCSETFILKKNHSPNKDRCMRCYIREKEEELKKNNNQKK